MEVGNIDNAGISGPCRIGGETGERQSAEEAWSKVEEGRVVLLGRMLWVRQQVQTIRTSARVLPLAEVVMEGKAVEEQGV